MSQSGTQTTAERPIGVQSGTYRDHSVEEMCSALSDTPVEAVELGEAHVLPDVTESTLDDRLGRIDAAGLDVCGHGVVEFEGNPEDAEETVDLVDRLGGDYLAVEFPPGDQDVADALLEHADDYDMDLALHNHGPESSYPSVEDVDAVVADVDDAWLGACVDTGHFLRSGESPSEVIPTLGDRVYALHLTDFLDEDEAVPGEGALDVAELLDLLDEQATFDRPLVIEYEVAGDDPTPAIRQAAENVREASR